MIRIRCLYDNELYDSTCLFNRGKQKGQVIIGSIDAVHEIDFLGLVISCEIILESSQRFWIRGQHWD